MHTVCFTGAWQCYVCGIKINTQSKKNDERLLFTAYSQLTKKKQVVLMNVGNGPYALAASSTVTFHQTFSDKYPGVHNASFESFR